MPDLLSVISCGKDNDYGHPSPETLTLYETLGISHYRTDRQGSVIITTDGTSLQVDTER